MGPSAKKYTEKKSGKPKKKGFVGMKPHDLHAMKDSIDQTMDVLSEQSEKHDDLYDMVRETLQLQKRIYKQNKKIKSRLGVMVFMSYLKLALIAIPIILGVIYLPPLIEGFVNTYGDAVKAFQPGGQGFFTEEFLKQFDQETIKQLIRQ